MKSTANIKHYWCVHACIRVFVKERKIWVLRPFQEYFTYIEHIVIQRWAKTGVPGEKPPDLPVQNLASHMYTSEARTTAVRDPLFKSQRS